MHPREKSRLYHDLGELIRSGMTLPRAVEKLAAHSRGAVRRTLTGISAGLSRGGTLADAVAEQPEINELDAALLAASDRAGKLERGFALAAEYYGALAEARSRILSKLAYPLFIAHLAVVAFSLTRLMAETGGGAAVRDAMLFGFGVLWGSILIGWLLVRFIRQTASRNIMMDRSLGLIPILGGMRRDLALSRLTAAYDMQIEAGVNIFGALDASGRASASASYRDAMLRVAEDVRAGESVSTALVATRAFPERMVRAFMVGEESGRLDQELRKLSDEYRVGGLRKLEAISEWIPRLLFIGVAIFVGWWLVRMYTGYFNDMKKILEQ